MAVIHVKQAVIAGTAGRIMSEQFYCLLAFADGIQGEEMLQFYSTVLSSDCQMCVQMPLISAIIYTEAVLAIRPSRPWPTQTRAWPTQTKFCPTYTTPLGLHKICLAL